MISKLIIMVKVYQKNEDDGVVVSNNEFKIILRYI